MQRVFSNFIILFFCFILTACGGSSNDETIVPEPIDETPEPVTTSTINGTIKVASNIIKDGDLNDRSAPFVDNSSFLKAQEIPNIVTIQGFATAKPTIDLNGFSDDRFYQSIDADDYYLAYLQADQVVHLQSAQYNPQELPTPTEGDELYGDLDLSLFNYDSEETLASVETGETETIVIPKAGLYFINVHASKNAARYVLSIRQPSSATVAALRSSSRQVSGDDFVENELIIQFNDTLQAASTSGEFTGLTTNHAGKARPALAKLSSTVSAAASQHRTASGLQSLADRYPHAYEKLMTIRKMKSLAHSKNVKTVSLNYLRKPMRVPSDPLYSYQWHYPSMNLPQAWDITTGTPASGSVVVAVIDTGIISSHPDLKNKLVPGYDFIRDDDNSRDAEPGIDSNPEDPGDSTKLGASSWHGTHVAGTIAAESNNGIGVAGVSWGAKIMPLRVLGQFGGNTYDIMQAMNYAAGLDNDSGTKPAQPADIINLSLGGGGFSQQEADLFEKIYKQGIIIVAAAGNDNSNVASYPASYNGVISVSAMDFNKQRAPYSNFGPKIDIAAPGGSLTRDINQDGYGDGVLSTFADDNSGTPKPSYVFLQGTSMATPHVAGMFALMKAVNPALKATDIIGLNANEKKLLENEQLTDPAGITGKDDIYGYGTANALKAVQAARDLLGAIEEPEPPVILQATPASLNFSSGSLSSNLKISNEGDGTVSIVSVTNNNNWLSITELNNSNDPGSLGLYRVSATTDGLSEGFYFGTLEFHFDNESSLTVNVNLIVGIGDTGGKLSRIYVNLFDIEQEAVIDWTHVRENPDNELVFSFSQVPQGRYIIVAGTNIDNDGYICQLGEGCAVYPSSSQITPIDTQVPGTIDIEMTANIVSSQGINSISQFSAESALLLPVKQAKPDPTRLIQK